MVNDNSITSAPRVLRASPPVAATINTHRAFYTSDYEPFSSVRPEVDKRAPTYYPRETSFNVANLLLLSVAGLAGWGIGHLPVSIACGVLVAFVGALMVGNRWRA